MLTLPELVFNQEIMASNLIQLNNRFKAPVLKHHSILIASYLESPLGLMIAIADNHYLYFLSFMDVFKLEKQISRLEKQTSTRILFGSNLVISLLKQELKAYFSGELRKFTTPVLLVGSAFQTQVWQALTMIGYGNTISYAFLAAKVNNPKAYRAVGNANGNNPLVLIIPCHRVIQRNGSLGGYGCGILRKQWLITHERQKN